MRAEDTPRRVVITGVGVVGAGLGGGSAALGTYLARPTPGARALTASALTGMTEGVDPRRLSRVCQLTVAAARLAVRDADWSSDEGLGLVVGTEFGDLRSTREFADGYLARGQAGLSALLFPNTVMNTMAAATSIVLKARGLSLTINAPTIAGELAVARAGALIAAGRMECLLAGGVDEGDPCVSSTLEELGVASGTRGEGAGFLVLEWLEAARGRGARLLGEILGTASGGLPARPHGIGRSRRSRVVAQALARASLSTRDLGWVYASANGDDARDRWESSLLEGALAPHRPPVSALSRLSGHHAGMGAVRVAAAAWTARSGLLPATGSGLEHVSVRAGDVIRVPPGVGLVHAVARGGGQVAIVVGPPPDA
jgi:3-oxoacyl-(acyl-carrier-protein) synthase